ncbi:hypothetical protein [Hymenobacter sp. B1770]|uniref:hypothetical protein n=1 Tax=Hymenobacter sp. B1770 TaxID=1718788 RepID=UPI003CF368A2
MKIVFRFFLFFLLVVLGGTQARAQHAHLELALAVEPVQTAPTSPAQTPAQTAPTEPPVKAVPMTGRKRKPLRVDEDATEVAAGDQTDRSARPEQSARSARPEQSARGSRASEAGRGARGAASGAGRAAGAGLGRRQ